MIAYDPDGKSIAIVGSDEYRAKVWGYLLNLAFSSKTGLEQVNKAIKSKDVFIIFDPNDSDSDHLNNAVAGANDEAIGFDLSKANDNLDAEDGRNGKELVANALTNLGHELAHFNDKSSFGVLTENGKIDYSRSLVRQSEVHAVEVENQIRKELGLPERTHYSGYNVYGKEVVKAANGESGREYILTRKKSYAQTSRETVTTMQQSVFRNSIKISKPAAIGNHGYRSGKFLRTVVNPPNPNTQYIRIDEKK